jgi:hypothetical protein
MKSSCRNRTPHTGPFRPPLAHCWRCACLPNLVRRRPSLPDLSSSRRQPCATAGKAAPTFSSASIGREPTHWILPGIGAGLAMVGAKTSLLQTVCLLKVKWRNSSQKLECKARFWVPIKYFRGQPSLKDMFSASFFYQNSKKTFT